MGNKVGTPCVGQPPPRKKNEKMCLVTTRKLLFGRTQFLKILISKKIQDNKNIKEK